VAAFEAESGEMSIGRDTKCTPEIVEAVCERLAGGESLRSIAKDVDMPAVSTVLLWVVTGRLVEGTDVPFSEHYMQAREAGGYSHADRVIETVDKVCAGEIDPQAARAMLDGLKWAAERMAPKKHSPRQEIDHSSTDGSMTPSRPPTREELIAELESRGLPTTIFGK
jgi:hypothetical protein